MNCPDCGTKMVPMIMPGSAFCPNGCDRKPKGLAHLFGESSPLFERVASMYVTEELYLTDEEFDHLISLPEVKLGKGGPFYRNSKFHD